MARFQKLHSPETPGTPAIDEPQLEHRLTILNAAKDRQEKELADLQSQIDELSEDFASRAESIVRQGLYRSYGKARQRIGAIDLSFFDSGEELSPAIDIPSLPSIEEVTQ